MPRVTSGRLAQVRGAARTIRHRGPDGEGFLVCSGGRAVAAAGDEAPPELELPPLGACATGAPGLVMAHRRLSILDLSAMGHQPMSSPDGRLWIAFSGEVYNYIELREELRPHWDFRTATDTEVVLAAFSKWGPEAVRRFVGMFGIALLDLRESDREVLHLFRDQLGIKPLYWTQDAAGEFAFSSEIKGLIALGVRPRANNARLRDYLSHGLSNHHEECMFAGVYELPPAGWMRVAITPNGGHIEVRERLWQLRLENARTISIADAADAVRAAFLRNVRWHLRADVPVGVALSGGIDSTALGAAVRNLKPTAELHAFSYLATGEACDEDPWITIAAKATGAIRHNTALDAGDLTSTIDALVAAQEEPFGGTSYFAEYALFHLVRKSGIKVLLSGQGPDEMFAGYQYYLRSRMESLLRRGSLLSAHRFAAGAVDASGGGGALWWKASIRSLVPRSLQEALKNRADGGSQRGLNKTWLKLTEYSGGTGRWFQHRDILRQDLANDLFGSSIPSQLRCQDRSSMAHSVECRVPFLTPEMVELALSLPEEHLLGADGTSKLVLRKALRGVAPNAILDRRDKIGFQTPEKRWLLELQDWVTRQWDSETARNVPALDLPVIRREWDEVVAGRAPYKSRIWRWLNVILWSRRFDVRWD